jgi:hypothetical protein
MKQISGIDPESFGTSVIPMLSLFVGDGEKQNDWLFIVPTANEKLQKNTVGFQQLYLFLEIEQFFE